MTTTVSVNLHVDSPDIALYQTPSEVTRRAVAGDAFAVYAAWIRQVAAERRERDRRQMSDGEFERTYGEFAVDEAERHLRQLQAVVAFTECRFYLG